MHHDITCTCAQELAICDVEHLHNYDHDHTYNTNQINAAEIPKELMHLSIYCSTTPLQSR